VIAEKFQAMVVLGRASSRMKGFYDIWVLSRVSEFKDDRLARAIAATFARRNTEIPKLPDGLTPAFAADVTKVQQWNAFAEDVAFEPGTLAEVVEDLAAFLMPHARAARIRPVSSPNRRDERRRVRNRNRGQSLEYRRLSPNHLNNIFCRGHAHRALNAAQLPG
jgi:hypothetical protein